MENRKRESLENVNCQVYIFSRVRLKVIMLKLFAVEASHLRTRLWKLNISTGLRLAL